MKPEKDLTVQDVIEQLGGGVSIQYQDFMVVAPRAHVVDAVEMIKQEDTTSKKHILKSIQHSIKTLLPLLIAGTATQQQAMDCAQDISLWYANEIVEGRAELSSIN